MARAWLEERLVLLQPRLSLPQVFRRWSSIECCRRSASNSGAITPSPGGLGCLREEILTERWRKTLFDLTVRCLDEVVPDLSAHWLESVDEVEQSVTRIRKRGGQVVFVRFPTSGEITKLYDDRFPRGSTGTCSPELQRRVIHSADYRAIWIPMPGWIPPERQRRGSFHARAGRGAQAAQGTASHAR